MKSRPLICVQAILACASLLVVSMYPAATGPLQGVTAAGTFCVAALVLGLFSVWLPRGDQADTSGPIAFAAAAVLSPLLAVAAVTIAQLASSLARSKGRSAWSIVEYLSRRVLLVALVSRMVGPGLERSLSAGDFASRPEPYLLVGAAAVLFTLVDLLMNQLHASLRFEVPYVSLLLGNLRLQGWMIAAEVSVSILTVFIYPAMQYSTLIVTVGLLLVMRQSFALLLEVRASYTATVEVMARALEAYNPSRRGHAERVAALATEAGRMLGLQGSRLEDLNYAALFHDVGRIGADDDSEEVQRKSSEVLAGVGFLSGSAPILRILDSALDLEESFDEQDLVSAYVIAYLSARDDAVRSLGIDAEAAVSAIGARLYTSERRTVDRILRRVEQRAQIAGDESEHALEVPQ